MPGGLIALRDQRDVHGDGDARRRVRALARGAAARDHQRGRRRRRPAPLRRRTSRTPSRRSSATTAASASRSGSTSRRRTTSSSARSNPDGTQQVGIAGEFDGEQNDQGQGKPGDSLFSVQEISPNVMVGIVHRRATAPSTRARSSRSTRATRPTPSAWTPTQYANGGTVGHQCLNDENVHYTVLTPERPDRQRPVARRPLPRAERPARTAASSPRGPTARSTT